MIRILCCFIPDRKYRHMLRKCRFGRYKITGTNNCIEYCGYKLPKWVKIVGLNVCIKGNDNVISIGQPRSIRNSNIIIESKNVNITIGDGAILSGINFRCVYGLNQNITIGTNFTAYGADIYCDDISCLQIGNDVLFSNEIKIWCTDGHSILDFNTNDVTNISNGPVVIGDHCWIGQGVRILKNARIPKNTVVAGGSVVGKCFLKENTIIAGVPARIVKEQIKWDIENPYFLSLKRKRMINE